MNKSLSYYLSDQDVLQIIGSNAKMLTVPELRQYSSLDELFGYVDKIVLLYINTVRGNNIQGHWVLLTRVRRNGKTIYEYNDSYGNLPDHMIDKYSKQWLQRSKQSNYLSRLLLKASKEPNVEVHYNEIPFQGGGAIATCGRHVAIRGKFYQIPLKEYQQFFKKLKDRGVNLDIVAVKLTDYLAGKKLGHGKSDAAI